MGSGKWIFSFFTSHFYFMKIQQIILEGEFIRLESLKMEHLDALCEIGLEEEIWRWNPAAVESHGDMKRYVETALAEQKRGVSLPFAIVEKSSGKIIGSTRFGNIDVKNRRVEIGWTWIASNWQRTFVNTEAKLLMLAHAFETWKCVRVELKTDLLNEKSKNAILRLGAKQEGILRQHIITKTKRLRDTVYFSILDSEWHDIKLNLKTKLRSYK